MSGSKLPLVSGLSCYWKLCLFNKVFENGDYSQTIQQEHSTLVEKGDRVTALFEVCMNQLDAQINL